MPDCFVFFTFKIYVLKITVIYEPQKHTVTIYSQHSLQGKARTQSAQCLRSKFYSVTYSTSTSDIKDFRVIT